MRRLRGVGGFAVNHRPLCRDQKWAFNGISSVTQQHERVIVLASGPSGAGPWPQHPGVPVIAVNGAIDGLSWDPNYWITLDPSPVNQARFQRRRAGTVYFVAVDEDHGPTARNVNHRADFSGCRRLLRQRGVGMPADPRVIHVGNSGRAGIQLARHMGAKRIAVFGVDASDAPHWYDSDVRSGNLKGLPGLLQELKDPAVDIRFADVGGSNVAGFSKARPQEVLAWIRSRIEL